MDKQAQLVVTARITFGNSITTGNEYEVISQTQTGFLIKDDQGHLIDLYYHMFNIGIKVGDQTNYLPQKLGPVSEIDTAVKEVLDSDPAPQVDSFQDFDLGLSESSDTDPEPETDLSDEFAL